MTIMFAMGTPFARHASSAASASQRYFHVQARVNRVKAASHTTTSPVRFPELLIPCRRMNHCVGHFLARGVAGGHFCRETRPPDLRRASGMDRPALAG